VGEDQKSLTQKFFVKTNKQMSPSIEPHLVPFSPVNEHAFTQAGPSTAACYHCFRHKLSIAVNSSRGTEPLPLPVLWTKSSRGESSHVLLSSAKREKKIKPFDHVTVGARSLSRHVEFTYPLPSFLSIFPFHLSFQPSFLPTIFPSFFLLLQHLSCP